MQLRIRSHVCESQTVRVISYIAGKGINFPLSVLFFIKHGKPLLIAGCDFNGFRALHKVHGVAIGN